MQAAMLNGAAFGAFQQNEGLSPNQGSMRALRAFSILQGCPNGKVATSGEILPIVISRIKAAHYDPSYQSGYAIMKALARSEEHTSELQSLMRISYAVFCLKKKNQTNKA